jgi:hypothetical protein
MAFSYSSWKTEFRKLFASVQRTCARRLIYGQGPGETEASAPGFTLKKAFEKKSTNKKPTGCLLGACSGQHPMGYRFSLLTLLFSGVCSMIKRQNSIKLRLIL